MSQVNRHMRLKAVCTERKRIGRRSDTQKEELRQWDNGWCDPRTICMEAVGGHHLATTGRVYVDWEILGEEELRKTDSRIRSKRSQKEMVVRT